MCADTTVSVILTSRPHQATGVLAISSLSQIAAAIAAAAALPVRETGPSHST